MIVVKPATASVTASVTYNSQSCRQSSKYALLQKISKTMNQQQYVDCGVL